MKTIQLTAVFLLLFSPAAFADDHPALTIGASAGIGCIATGAVMAAAAMAEKDNPKVAAGIGCGIGTFAGAGLATGFVVMDSQNIDESDLQAPEPSGSNE